MSRKTTQTKGDLMKEVIGYGQPERLSLAEMRNKMFDNFYNNIRVLCAFETISMTQLARNLSMKSGNRMVDLCYGRLQPNLEELVVLSKHFKISIDDLINKKAKIIFE